MAAANETKPAPNPDRQNTRLTIYDTVVQYTLISMRFPAIRAVMKYYNLLIINNLLYISEITTPCMISTR